MSIKSTDGKVGIKYYIRNSQGNIEWVPNKYIARRMVASLEYSEWYGKTVLETEEDIIQDEFGKNYLKSEYVQLEKQKNIKEEIQVFKDQAKNYIDRVLLDYSTLHGFDNFYDMISYKDSKIRPFQGWAKKGLQYRDEIYNFHLDFIEKLEKELTDTTDFSVYYKDYYENFPKSKD